MTPELDCRVVGSGDAMCIGVGVIERQLSDLKALQEARLAGLESLIQARFETVDKTLGTIKDLAAKHNGRLTTTEQGLQAVREWQAGHDPNAALDSIRKQVEALRDRVVTADAYRNSLVWVLGLAATVLTVIISVMQVSRR